MDVIVVTQLIVSSIGYFVGGAGLGLIIAVPLFRKYGLKGDKGDPGRPASLSHLSPNSVRSFLGYDAYEPTVSDDNTDTVPIEKPKTN